MREDPRRLPFGDARYGRPGPGWPTFAIRYCDVEIYGSARKHGVADDDIAHAIEHALAVGEQADGKVLYLGPDRAANLLEVVFRSA
jgi:hypothetical protein